MSDRATPEGEDTTASAQNDEVCADCGLPRKVGYCACSEEPRPPLRTQDTTASTERHQQKLAWDAVERAVRRGELVPREECERCGRGGRIEAHHADYTKRLEVEWICVRCHQGEHNSESTKAAKGGRKRRRDAALTDDQAERIRQMVDSGTSYRDAGEAFGVSKWVVRAIVKGRAYV